MIIQGSGPADRTGNGYFTPIQDAFLSHGIGTFAFDKPGCGDSTGDWRDYALEDRADQILVARDTVRKSSMGDVNSIGIWGQSQVGWLVQMLASRRTDLSLVQSPTLALPSTFRTRIGTDVNTRCLQPNIGRPTSSTL